MFYDSVGQWAALSVWVILAWVEWSRLASLTCLGWLGWLGPLSTRSFIPQGIAWVCHMAAEGFPAAREGKPQSTYIFQASACVTFTNVPLVKASHIGLRAWIQEAWFMGVITAMIYQSMYQTITLTLQSPNCGSGALGHQSEFTVTVAGYFTILRET